MNERIFRFLFRRKFRELQCLKRDYSEACSSLSQVV